MSQSLNEIQQTILDAKASVSELDALEVLTEEEKASMDVNSDSKVSGWRLWVWVMAYLHWVQQKLWDVFYQDILEIVAKSRVHNKLWYQEQALAFQYGFDIGENTHYDNTGYSEEEVANSKIIRHASVVKQTIQGRGVLRIKVAREENGVKTALTESQLVAFTDYMNKVADAGTTVFPTTGIADDLIIFATIYYDPSVLSPTGQRLDGSETGFPVINAINNHLENLKFDGRLILTHLTDDLQRVDGVVLPVIKYAESRYGSHSWQTPDPITIDDRKEIITAESGYMLLIQAGGIIEYLPFKN